MNLPGWIATPIVGEADPVDDPDASPGVEGNSRLTSATGMVLLVLLAVEGVTILSVRQMITLHIAVGVLLLGPVLLKTGSTMYRFTRYYTGAPSYRRKGPPHLLLRVSGTAGDPVQSRATGHRDRPDHRGHIGVRRLADGAPDVLLDLGRADDGARARPSVIRRRRRRGRDFVVRCAGRPPAGGAGGTPPSSVALLVGVGAATALLPTASSWINRPAGHFSGPAGAHPPP